MKRLGLVCIVVLLFSIVGVVFGDVPRHVDPAMYELVGPDPDTLFLLYHNMYRGMVLENLTLQEEWLRMIESVYSVDELVPLLKEYGELVEFEAVSLNLTRYHLDMVVGYIGELNVSAAESCYFKGLEYLEASNATLGVLWGKTLELGEAVGGDLGVLLEDLDDVEELMGGYGDFAQLLADFIAGGELDPGDIDEIKSSLGGVVDDDLLEMIEDYLNDVESGVDVGALEMSSLGVVVNVSEAWVGSRVRVSGRLTGGGIGLEDRRVQVKIGGNSVIVVTGKGGGYSLDISVPYLYEKSVDVRGFYWPSGEDALAYSPALGRSKLDLLYMVPDLEVTGDSVGLPGRTWNFSGRVLGESGGLKDISVDIVGFGAKESVVTDVGGVFNGSLMVSPEAKTGQTMVSVESSPVGVYRDVEERMVVEVLRLPLRLEVVEPGLVFSGLSVGYRYSVSAGGEPLNGCRVEVFGERASSVDYSVDGEGIARLYVPLLRVGGGYRWRVVADPVQPWINGASLSGEFSVVNSLFALFFTGVSAVAVYSVWRYLDGRRVEVFEEVVPVVGSEVEPVVEPVAPTGFSGLFLAALRVVEGLSGVVMLPSDTLREYMFRVVDRLGDRVGGLFRELVLRYEAWLYGRPSEAELEQVMVLVDGIEEDLDED